MTITLYGMSTSGNCWKPAALMRLLNRPYQWVEVDILRGESRTPDYLAKNPNGKVPLLAETHLDGTHYLAESNAMLCYLAEGTSWLPTQQWLRAQVLQWLFFEQYSHEPYIATVRFWIAFAKQAEARAEQIAASRIKGYAALTVMEQQLAKTAFLVGEKPTIADLSLFAYTHVADEGGYDLSAYPHIQRWMQQLKALPSFASMRE